MLFPRFTIRTALVIVTGCAVVFLIAGTAYRGQMWAWGVTIAVASVLLTALVHAAWFGVVWLFSQVSSDPQTAVELPRRDVLAATGGGGPDVVSGEASGAAESREDGSP